MNNSKWILITNGIIAASTATAIIITGKWWCLFILIIGVSFEKKSE
jgi:hypothetical protein